MPKATKTQAEEKFAANQKRQKQALKEQEKARVERANQISELRTKRLAKEAIDKAGKS